MFSTLDFFVICACPAKAYGIALRGFKLAQVACVLRVVLCFSRRSMPALARGACRGRYGDFVWCQINIFLFARKRVCGGSGRGFQFLFYFLLLEVLFDLLVLGFGSVAPQQCTKAGGAGSLSF